VTRLFLPSPLVGVETSEARSRGGGTKSVPDEGFASAEKDLSPDLAEFIIGRRFAPTRWRSHPLYRAVSFDNIARLHIGSKINRGLRANYVTVDRRHDQIANAESSRRNGKKRLGKRAGDVCLLGQSRHDVEVRALPLLTRSGQRGYRRQVRTRRAGLYPALWKASIGRAQRIALVAMAMAAASLGWQNSARTQESSHAGQSARIPGLPSFQRCAPTSPPVLPRRWHAIALMAPFEDGQLDVGEFVYDAAVPAMRASVSGTESGMIDLLITNENTYELTGPRQFPTACVSSRSAFNPPSRQWLSSEAQCVGKAPVMSNLMEWWTMPSAESAATWYWYRDNTRIPWRTMRIAPSVDPAVIGSYAMTNFTTFEELPRTNLAALRDFCRSRNATSGIDASASITSVRELMEAQPDKASDAQGPARAASLVSGLDRGACMSVKPPRWPARFEMTAMMISTNFQNGPYPAEIFYDWNGANAQLTRLHDPENPSSRATLDGLLVGGAGYHITRDQSGAHVCERAYPGIIRPDWMTTDKCQCRAIVKNNPALERNDTIQIFSCPVQPEGVFWAWYSTTGRPITFRSTALIRSGLTLADYYRWTSKTAFPTGILEIPSQCNRNSLSKPSEASFTSNCSGCHVTSEQAR
jgi:hypothetical protein